MSDERVRHAEALLRLVDGELARLEADLQAVRRQVAAARVDLADEIIRATADRVRTP